ncbi:DUF6005 family protein [Rubritalea spongiae]|uniref:DUF6005 family protein n=1 Tax=Rubritalea spongiae TaxID=430797 RepID=A0ABW5DYR8_9BACT
MKRSEVLEVIERVLRQEMEHKHMELFHECAAISEDLQIDSVGMLQLLLHIELSAGLELPEDSFSFADVVTVKDLADLLLGHFEGAAEETATDEVTVHCLVSCFCDALKEKGIDYRPLYFGLWDAPFFYEKGRVFYHKLEIDHSLYIKGFECLYGAQVTQWYDHSQSQKENVDSFEGLLATKDSAEEVVAMVDMSKLPARENKYYQKVFPHYAIFEEVAVGKNLLMRDPDFRWSGEVERKQVLESMLIPSIGGGYSYNTEVLHEATRDEVARYFDATLNEQENVYQTLLRQCLDDYGSGSSAYPLSKLGEALQELPVIAIRKYAYEHAFAYYWLQQVYSEEQFERMCESIAELAEGFNQFHYLAMKYSVTGSASALQKASDSLKELDALEFAIKAELRTAHQSWVASFNKNREGVLA